MGHSDATFEQAMQAFACGATHVTHLFNAQTPLHHRKPGVVGAGLSGDVYTELIADTFHVNPGLFALIAKCKKDKLVLITDCTRAGGMPDGEYTLGGQKIFIGGDVETLGSDTIASMYSDADLKCDFMQLCHHGYYGGSTAMYGKINPEIVVWPAAKTFAESNKGIDVNKYWLSNPNVKEVYIAGDGEVTFVLPYTPKAQAGN